MTVTCNLLFVLEALCFSFKTVDFVQGIKDVSLLTMYDKYRRRADEKVCCDYSLHVIVTWWGEQVKQEMKLLTEEKGVNSFKMFMAYKGVIMIDDYSVSSYSN